ncbi:MAG TPA: trypsin-like peptidase domain-containing protein [Chitinophagaceae bacterium]|jgi:Do/DeqQ family serine protease|nr:trypsin-like peptidase domain-containing protein [Chitinophagaceae bacterium]
MKRFLPVILLLLVFAAVVWGLILIGRNTFPKEPSAGAARTNESKAFLTGTPPNLQFVPAARAATPAIVHIKTGFAPAEREQLLYEYYGIPQGEGARGSGSGVTISKDGYIATNNHVVEGAATIEVIFPDRRMFSARLIGRDPNTDLALLKVDGKDLPVVEFGNSDAVEVGEWVLAIGYPFSLNTTVTAGIVSAKGRSIGILDQPRPAAEGAPAGSAIESFIQTDAAINPGNSGGALVNTEGKLVGINAAIASQTGSYAGYGFAIPSNLARKVLDDLKQFGEVRRGYLGVSFPAPLVEEQYYRQQGIDPSKVRGVLITGVQPGSAAAAAGLKEGDIVQSINGTRLASSAEFSERIARLRPGDKVELSVQRSGSARTVTAVLKGEQAIAAAGGGGLQEMMERLGAAFGPLPDEYRQRYRLRSGVVVTDVRRGGLFDQVGIAPGTTIVLINGRPVRSPQDIEALLSSSPGSQVRIDGLAPDGSRVMFTFSLGA